jgi:uncharacterized Zn finger protein (UPF0148 family)
MKRDLKANWGGEIVRANMVSQIMEVEKMLFKGSCSKCNGVAYFSKMDGSPAFCPMCGEDAKDNWAQEKVVGSERSEQLESLVRELAEALQLYENWEAKLIMDDSLWQSASGLPFITQEVWDDLVAVQTERNKVLHKAKEVLGDE